MKTLRRLPFTLLLFIFMSHCVDRLDPNADPNRTQSEFRPIDKSSGNKLSLPRTVIKGSLAPCGHFNISSPYTGYWAHPGGILSVPVFIDENIDLKYYYFQIKGATEYIRTTYSKISISAFYIEIEFPQEIIPSTFELHLSVEDSAGLCSNILKVSVNVVAQSSPTGTNTPASTTTMTSTTVTTTNTSTSTTETTNTLSTTTNTVTTTISTTTTCQPYTNTFISESALDGDVTSSLLINAGGTQMRIGDVVIGLLGVRSFVSFDISSIPAGIIITDATLGMTQVGIVGNPSKLGANIIVDHVNYGTSLDAGDFNIGALAGNIGLIPVNGPNGLKIIDVKTYLQNDLAAMRLKSQYRLRMQTNNDLLLDDQTRFGTAESAAKPQLSVSGLICP